MELRKTLGVSSAWDVHGMYPGLPRRSPTNVAQVRRPIITYIRMAPYINYVYNLRLKPNSRLPFLKEDLCDTGACIINVEGYVEIFPIKILQSKPAGCRVLRNPGYQDSEDFNLFIKVGFATIMVLFLGTERRTPTPPDRHGCVSRSTGRYDDESRFQAHNRCNIIYSSQLT